MRKLCPSFSPDSVLPPWSDAATEVADSSPGDPRLPSRRIPPDVELILSAMEAGGNGQPQRRALGRVNWRVQASLRLFIDPAGQPPRTVYTRDVHARSLGFITAQRLPLGYGGVVDLPAQDGMIVSIACTLLRCRQAAPGWYEGVVYFNREQAGMERLIG